MRILIYKILTLNW